MKLSLLLALFGLLAQPAVAAAADWTVDPRPTLRRRPPELPLHDQPGRRGRGRRGRHQPRRRAAPAHAAPGVGVGAPRPARRDRPGRRDRAASVRDRGPRATPSPATTSAACAGVPIRLRVGGPLTKLAVEDVRIDYANSAFGKGTPPSATRCATPATRSSAPARPCRSPARSGSPRSPRASSPTRASSRPAPASRVSAPLHGVTPAVRSTATVKVIPLLPDAAGSIAPLPASRRPAGPGRSRGRCWRRSRWSAPSPSRSHDAAGSASRPRLPAWSHASRRPSRLAECSSV